jgi:hypothetical protein
VSPSSPDPAARATATLALHIAGLPGPAFQLDPGGENVLGRAAGSLIVLADRLASRSHALIRFEAGRGSWLIEDLGSRNGTWLDGTRVTRADLAAGSVIRVGTTELVFHPGAVVPAAGDEDAAVVRCGSPDVLEGEALRRAGGGGDPRWPMFLYQAGFRLLAAASTREVVGTTLELAAEFTAAASFGWFEISPERHPLPTCVVPPGSDLPTRLTGRLWEEATAGHGVWFASRTEDEGGPAVACVPIIAGSRIRAVLAAATPGDLKEVDFDLLVSLAGLAAAAWAGRDPLCRQAGAAASTERLDDQAIGLESFEIPPDGTLALSEAEAEMLRASADAALPLARAESLDLETWERLLTIEALRRTGGGVAEAAALLGIGRATLYRRLEAFGLRRDAPPAAPG